MQSFCPASVGNPTVGSRSIAAHVSAAAVSPPHVDRIRCVRGWRVRQSPDLQHLSCAKALPAANVEQVLSQPICDHHNPSPSPGPL